MLRLLTHKYFITVSRTDAVKEAVKALGRAPGSCVYDRTARGVINYGRAKLIRTTRFQYA